ncbi:syntabulin-like [Meleagris gallopavo]|uniref:syntabulin-like n=1 Tax=Meleagris gallopavo TaxID=9103 RepID=UPI000549C34E|nr:syntabulin-like [Meleagris gallopavo]
MAAQPPIPTALRSALLLRVHDTGCPSSQSVSPVKTPSDAGHSPISFCTGSDGDFSRKKFSAGTMNEGNSPLARYKKDTKTSLVKPGEYDIVPFI